jgi:DNA helicase-2/ATP-dependent DNA helicase PcrA
VLKKGLICIIFLIFAENLYTVHSILSKLNTSQQEAVKNYQGSALVIAGAGSGKTRVLTYRIAYLISQGVSPERILALTFTNKAAKEMKSRIIEIVGPAAKKIKMGTFHSVFSSFLRVEADKLGYTSNFTIYDTDDSKSLIKAIVKELQLDDKTYSPSYIQSRISSAKSMLISPQEYLNDTDIQNHDYSARRPRIGEIYTLYNKRCFKANAMDFDDLLFNMNYLLKKHQDVLHKYQHFFQYMLVDEYQDTNYAQYIIIKALAAVNENICVVGDDAQSIYAFRGANINNIFNFKKDYPDHIVYKLEQNYRSTKNIVEAANSIIVNNKRQIKKKLWTENDCGDKITLIATSSDQEEGKAIANTIKDKLLQNEFQPNDIAILYRTNAQSRVMEDSLRRLSIKYRIYGGLSFYHRKEIKDILAYFRLSINHQDDEALRRIINYPARGIGKTSYEKMLVKANEMNISVWELINQHLERAELGSGITKKVQEFVTMIKSFNVYLEQKNAFDLGMHILQSTRILSELKKEDIPENIERIDNIEELMNSIKEFIVNHPQKEENQDAFIPLTEYMKDVALISDADNEEKNEGDKVSLMTIHMAKGLEYPCVFISGLEENLFPSGQSLMSQEDIEEERRLFYVALTRAMKKLYLSYAETRYKWGNLLFAEPSRFIDEIEDCYLENNYIGMQQSSNSIKAFPSTSSTILKKAEPKSKVKPNMKKLSQTSTTDSSIDYSVFQNGMRVEHERFGKGKIIKIEGEAASSKAIVFFEKIGEKQLLLRFAKLKIIE